MASRVLVSSCLLGEKVRYHGGSALIEHPVLRRWLSEGRVVPFCPEVAGGLATPRPPAEIAGGRDGLRVLRGEAAVTTRDGEDVTAAFVSGAVQAVATARQHGIRVALLKEASPSCGTGFIYDGSFTGQRAAGRGVAAAALAEAGVRIFNETQLAEADALLAALDKGAKAS